MGWGKDEKVSMNHMRKKKLADTKGKSGGVSGCPRKRTICLLGVFVWGAPSDVESRRIGWLGSRRQGSCADQKGKDSKDMREEGEKAGGKRREGWGVFLREAEAASSSFVS